MGYAIVPNIKDEAVVCQQPCQHKDCAANRAMWTDAKCAICGLPMLPGQTFYFDDNGKPEHASCLYDKVNKLKEE